MRKIGFVLLLLVVLAAGCMTRHNLVWVPNEAACQYYGVSDEEIKRAIARGPRSTRALQGVVVKYTPDGRPIRLGEVGTFQVRER